MAGRAKSAGKPPPHGGSVRIIGGDWRSRRLEFPASDGLRPTPDRVRETLFNWLQPWLPGAACLDLFAGSGVLGFEALSRGAGHAVLVEKDTHAAAALRTNIALLQAHNAELVQSDALAFLQRAARPFDIVFLDPPYHSDLLAGCCAQLDAGGWIRPGGLIYMEAHGVQDPPLPPGWSLLRSKRAGQVGYHLARRSAKESLNKWQKLSAWVPSPKGRGTG